MSFGHSAIPSAAREEQATDELSLETRTRSSLLNVQNNIRSLGDQIFRLTQCPPTPKTVSIMKSLIDESSATILTLNSQLRQWKKTCCTDAAASTRKKLLLPPLESGFNAEVEKLKRFQIVVETTEKQLKSSDLIDAFTLMRPSEGGESRSSQQVHSITTQGILAPSSLAMTRFEVSETPGELLDAKEPDTYQPVYESPLRHTTESEQQLSSTMLPVVNSTSSSTKQFLLRRQHEPYFSSNPIEFGAPAVLGRQLYMNDENDPSSGATTKHSVLTSLSSSTVTGRSGSPTSEEDEEDPATLSNGTSTPTSWNRLVGHQQRHQSVTADRFLEDDYLHQTYRSSQPKTSSCDAAKQNADAHDYDEDDIQEFSGLLSRGSIRSASYLDGWHVTVDHPGDDLDLYVSRERFRGFRRIKAQLSQISNVFRELAHLINEQQDDLDLIDSNVINIKSSTGSAVDELRKAHTLKQRARRRNCFMVLITLAVLAVVVFVYLLNNPSLPSYIAPAMTPPASLANLVPSPLHDVLTMSQKRTSQRPDGDQDDSSSRSEALSGGARLKKRVSKEQ